MKIFDWDILSFDSRPCEYLTEPYTTFDSRSSYFSLTGPYLLIILSSIPSLICLVLVLALSWLFFSELSGRTDLDQGSRASFPQGCTRGLTLTNPLAQEALLPPPNVACVPTSSSSSFQSSNGSSSSSSGGSGNDGVIEIMDVGTTILNDIRMALWSLSQCEQWLTAVAGSDGGYRTAG